MRMLRTSPNQRNRFDHYLGRVFRRRFHLIRLQMSLHTNFCWRRDSTSHQRRSTKKRRFCGQSIRNREMQYDCYSTEEPILRSLTIPKRPFYTKQRRLGIRMCYEYSSIGKSTLTQRIRLDRRHCTSLQQMEEGH